jgi:orotate phosphoribosyltransferase
MERMGASSIKDERADDEPRTADVERFAPRALTTVDVLERRRVQTAVLYTTGRMASREDLLDLFRKSGALLDGHFRLSSGLHSTGYLQCALVLQHPGDAEQLGRAIAARTLELRPSAILSPALGGVVIGHEVARALGVRALFAERQDGILTLRRGFMLSEADRVLVVEDVLTTGGSTRETMQVARAAGGQVVGAAAIVDRSGGTASFDVPFHALLAVDLPTYQPEECPLCAKGLPVVKPGSRPLAG